MKALIAVVIAAYLAWKALPYFDLPDVCLICSGVILIALVVGAGLEFRQTLRNHRSW